MSLQRANHSHSLLSVALPVARPEAPAQCGYNVLMSGFPEPQTHKTADQKIDEGAKVSGWWRLAAVTFLGNGYEQYMSKRLSEEQPLRWAYITNAPKSRLAQFLIMKSQYPYTGKMAHTIRMNFHKFHIPI